MELQHVNVKFFVDGELAVEPVRFIDIFHRWIQDDVMPGLLIDVADYRHVPEGPGVLLVGHEADYCMDCTHGRWGLRYNRKAPLDGTNEDRFAQALASAARACLQMNEDCAAAGGLAFAANELELFINDRAFAPNTAETWAAVEPELRAFFKDRLGHDDFSLTHHADPRARCGATLKTGQAFDLPSLT